MSRPIAILCSAAVVLLLGASFALLRRPAAEEPAASAAALERLTARLDQEVAARQALEREVAALRVALELAAVASAPADAVAPGRGPGGRSAAADTGAAREAPAFDAEAVREALGRSLGGGGGPAGGQPWFDDGRLAQAGFEPAEIEALRGHFERHEMARLELRTQAEREGWLRTPRYRSEQRALDAEFAGLREEVGERSYDWLLYASGRPNRVQVTDVLDRSPAGEAGLQPGDVLRRYDGQSVHDARAVRRATAEGRAGDLVAVDFEREGVPERVWVPRGPLGVRLRQASLRPETP